MCVCTCVCTCVCIHVKDKDWLWVVSPPTLPFTFWESLSLNPESTGLARLAGKQFPRILLPLSLPPEHWESRGGLSHLEFFLRGSWNPTQFFMLIGQDYCLTHLLSLLFSVFINSSLSGIQHYIVLGSCIFSLAKCILVASVCCACQCRSEMFDI